LLSAVVERFAAGGYGVCRTAEGVIFVRGAIPGEEIEITRIERRRGVGWARAWRLLTRSHDRIESVCPHFPLCGGCDFHHLKYERELEAKRETTAQTLKKISGLAVAVEGPFVPRTGARPLGYRNTIRIQGGAGYLGYCERESHSIVDIADCPIAADAIRAEIPNRKAKAIAQPPKSVTLRAGEAGPHDPTLAVSVLTTSHGRTEIESVTPGRELDTDVRKESSVPPCTPSSYDNSLYSNVADLQTVPVGTAPVGTVWIRLLDRAYRVSPRSFFQINTEVAGELIGDLRDLLPPGRRLFDLFAGVGAFAIALADRFERVEAFEISRSAVDDFRANAAGLTNLSIQEWDAARGLGERVARGGATQALKKCPGQDDIVIVDPPRVGLPERLTADLARLRPSAIAYVSCDPATLARDLKALVAAGYEFARPVRLYDMFPRTAHVESLAILIRR
jgi:23S rRNA (uracil1939-C5)-methyltransferase